MLSVNRINELKIDAKKMPFWKFVRQTKVSARATGTSLAVTSLSLSVTQSAADLRQGSHESSRAVELGNLTCRGIDDAGEHLPPQPANRSPAVG